MKNTITLAIALLFAPLVALHAADAPGDSSRAWAKAPVVANKVNDA